MNGPDTRRSGSQEPTALPPPVARELTYGLPDGDDRPVAIDELREMFADVTDVEPLYYRGRVANDQASEDIAMKEEFCRPLADRFEVSREAMRIRLEQLGLLVLKKENTLF